jgi:hypothetical protein
MIPVHIAPLILYRSRRSVGLGVFNSFHEFSCRGARHNDARKYAGLCMMSGARRSEVFGLNGADEPAHEFDPGHQFGTTDCDPLRRSTRGRNCFFLIFCIAGLLFIVLRARSTLGAYRIPRATGLLIWHLSKICRDFSLATCAILAPCDTLSISASQPRRR